jgi:hemoglobin-like flavoprotein
VVHIGGETMGRRPEHLQLRGSVYWLRVRVPDDLRPILGKGEIRRSLRTSDALEAKRRVRIERIKVEAEFDEARRQPTGRTATAEKAPAIELSEEQIWRLATQWFIQAERRTSGVDLNDLSEDGVEAVEDSAVYAEEWQAVGSSIDKAVDDLLTEAGLPPAPRPWPTSYAKLARVIHQAMIENQRRLANRMHGHTRFTLNPQFASLSAATDLQPVATNRALTLSQLIERYESDPARPKPSGKTKLKADAQ